MSKKILIMAGGTGGHIFPALAIARELSSRGMDIVWLGSKGGMEEKIIPKHGYPIHCIHSSGLRGKSLFAFIKGVCLLAIGFIQTISLFLKNKPNIVIGMGGYASGVGGIVAKIFFTRLVIHEQNAIPGTTNRLLSRILIPVLILITAIIIFFSYERNNNSYLEKLTAIDNKLSGDLYDKIDSSSLINDLHAYNFQILGPKVESVSTQDIKADEITNEILFLNFNDEVWIEIENDKEVLISKIFQKNDEISLEIAREENVFITSGNLGSITIKTNHSEEQALGSNGEIGRKKIF